MDSDKAMKEPDGYIRPAPGVSPLKIYRLTQGQVKGWNTYTSCVVIAASKGDARRIHPSGGPWPSDRWGDGDWVSRNEVGKVNAVEIGIANDNWRAGTVICASNTGS